MIRKRMLINIMPITFIILAFIFDSPQNIISGLGRIITNPSILVTDYLSVGGLGATLINASLIILLNLWIIKVNDLRIGGGLFAAFLTVIGFSFFGKNILNILPIYFGAFLYSKYQKINYRSIILIAMFSTSIAPVVSVFMFGLFDQIIIGIILGLAVGIFVGFIITPVSAHFIKFHMGYNLYNVGFTMGVIGMIITAILRKLGYNYEMQYHVSTDYHNILFVYIFLLSITFMSIGYVRNGFSFKGYGRVLKSSGRAITNFVTNVGIDLTFINIGLMGLFSLFIITVFNIKISGPVFAGIMTVLGFSAFGKHPKNVVPVMLGAIIVITILGLDVTSAGIAMSLFFVTGLAPIAGQYGVIPGIITGMIHIFLVTSTANYHGYLNLYNNGFSAGFVAALMIPLIDAFNKKGSY